MSQIFNSVILPCESVEEQNQKQEQKQKQKQKQDVEVYHGIRIYPLRFGIYRSRYSTGELKPFAHLDDSGGKEPVPVSPGTYPEPQGDGYSYFVMPLREGWLYLYSEKGKGVYEFFFNGKVFRKKNFLAKEKKKDFWIVDTGGGPYLSLSEKDKVKLFYSDVRLTEKCMISKFLQDSKNELATNFDCDWGGSTSLDDRKIDTADISSYGCYPIKGDFGYEKDYVKDYDSYMNAAYLNNEEKQTNRDVFVILDDPIGISKQFQYDLEESHLNHEAFVRSIRTGKEFNLVKDKLLSYTGATEDRVIPDEKLLGEDCSHYQSIHGLGIMLYNLLYTCGREDSFIKKARRASSEEQIKKILAFSERGQLRGIIENRRKTMDGFIRGDLFQKYCEFFHSCDLAGGDEKQRGLHSKMLVQVKMLVTDPYKALSVLPHSKDDYIDGGVKNYTDLYDKTFKDVVNESNAPGRLLNKEINLEDLGYDFNENTGVSENIEELFFFVNLIMISFWRAVLDQQDTTFKIKLFESNTKRGLFEVNRSELDAALMKMERMVTNEGQVVQKAANGRYRFLKADSYNIERGKFKVLTESMIGRNSSRIGRSVAFAKYVTQHPVYFGISTLFYLRTLKRICEDLKNDEYQKAIFSSLELAVGVSALTTLFMEKMAEQQIGIGGRVTTSNIPKLSNVFNKIMAVGFVFDLVDSWQKALTKTFEKDYDAALFYSLAGGVAFGGVSTAIMAIFKFSAYSGWVGLAFSVLVIVFVKLAEHYSDSELEKFIHSTIFSDNYSYPFQNGGDIHNFYKDIQALGTTLALSQARDKTFLADYNCQIEEFLMCQLLVPNFRLDFRYLSASLIYAPGAYIPLNERIDGISISLELDLAYYNEQIEEMEIHSYYLRKKDSKRGDRLLPDNDGGRCYNQENRNKFYYNFVIRDKKESFFNNKEAYILTYIRFYDRNGKVLPLERRNKKKELDTIYLIYRHKISMKETQWGSGRLDYQNVEVTLDRVKLGTLEEGLMKK